MKQSKTNGIKIMMSSDHIINTNFSRNKQRNNHPFFFPCKVRIYWYSVLINSSWCLLPLKLWFPRAAAMQYSERAMTVNDVTKTLPQLTKERGCLESVGR